MRIPGSIIRCLIATVWTIFVVLAFHAFWVNGTDVWVKVTHLSWGSISGLYFLGLAAILVVSSAYLIALFRAKRDSTIHMVAISFLILILVCRILWVRYFDSQLYSDLLLYWNIGHSIVVDGVAAQSHWGLYFMRAIFYTAPIQYIFGDNQQALELVNVFLVTVTMFIFYDFGRRAFSARIAAGALLFFAWNPNIWYAVTLASHDIAYLPWLAGLCWIIYWINKRLHDRSGISITLVLVSVTAGLLIFLLDVQRSYGLFAWVALLLLLAYYLYNHYRESRLNIVNKASQPHLPGKDWLKRGLVFVLVLLIIPLGTYQLSKAVFKNTTGTWWEADYIPMLTSYNVLSSGEYKDMQPWRRVYWERLPEDLQTEFSIRKLLSEISSDPVETIRHVFRKNAVLADPTEELKWSIHPAEDPWVGRINSATAPMQRELHKLLAAILFFLLFLRLLLYPFFPIKRGALFLVLFTAFLYLFMIFFSIVQPRYSQFTVFLTSLLIAQLIFGGWKLKDIPWWNSIKRLPSRAIWRKRLQMK